MFVKTRDIVAGSVLKWFVMVVGVAVLAAFWGAANTSAAGVADVREVFGAVGDGVADDTVAVQAAFDSGYDIVVFPEGEYRFTDQLRFARGDKRIIGERATLFADDSYVYTGRPQEREWAIVIWGVNNITIEGMRFESRQTTNTFWQHIGVLAASDIHFKNNDFQSFRHPYYKVGVDFYTGWHNVSIENCQFGMPENDSDRPGSAVIFRDVLDQGASGGKLINSTIYKYDIDETIWIRGSEQATNIVSDIEISGNRMYLGDPADGSSTNIYTIALRGYSPRQLRNIRIHDNEIIGQGSGSLFILEGAENVEIFNNDLYTLGGALFGSRNETVSPNTPGTVKIRNNRTVAIDGGRIAGSRLTRGANPYDVVDNPHIIVNTSSGFLVDHKGSFAGNNVTVNGNIYRNDGGGVISSSTKDVRNNNIYINGYADTFIRNMGVSLAAPATYTGNTIITSKKRPQAEGVSTLVDMWSFSMNGYPITVSNNTFINGSEVEDDDALESFTVANTGSNNVVDRTAAAPYSRLWLVSAGDTAPASQTVYVCNNVVKGFRAMRAPAQNLSFDLDCD